MPRAWCGRIAHASRKRSTHGGAACTSESAWVFMLVEMSMAVHIVTAVRTLPVFYLMWLMATDQAALANLTVLLVVELRLFGFVNGQRRNTCVFDVEITWVCCTYWLFTQGTRRWARRIGGFGCCSTYIAEPQQIPTPPQTFSLNYFISW